MNIHAYPHGDAVVLPAYIVLNPPAKQALPHCKGSGTTAVEAMLGAAIPRNGGKARGASRHLQLWGFRLCLLLPLFLKFSRFESFRWSRVMGLFELRLWQAHPSSCLAVFAPLLPRNLSHTVRKNIFCAISAS